MYKVLLVDDERAVRTIIQETLDWQRMDCQIVAAVKDGKEAYAVFQQAHPDLVIMDLQLEGMDGQELIRRIRQERMGAQVLVVGRQSDWETVRAAMQAGAADFLARTSLRKEVLEQTIMHLLARCDRLKQQEKQEEWRWQKDFRHDLLLLKNNYAIDDAMVRHQINSSVFAPYAEGYICAYLHVDNSKLYYEEHEQAHDLLQQQLKEQIRQCFPADIVYQCIFLNHHAAMLLLQGKQKQRMANLCHMVLHSLEDTYGLQASLVLSDVQQEGIWLYAVCRQLMIAEKHHFYRGSGTLLFYEEQETYTQADIKEENFPMDMLDAVSMRDFKRVYELLGRALRYMERKHIQPAQAIEYLIFLLYNIEGNELVKRHKKLYPMAKTVQKLRLCETFDKVKELITDGIIQLQAWIENEASDRYRREIVMIMDHIEQNYQHKLTLKMIAAMFSMSESSLSHLFKKETGVTLNHYINERRMRKAKELLLDTTYRIKDIAAAVGMEDQLYFNRVFRKFYHVAPSDFRKQLQSGHEASEQHIR